MNLSESHTFHKREEPNDGNDTRTTTDKGENEETNMHSEELEGAGNNSNELQMVAK